MTIDRISFDTSELDGLNEMLSAAAGRVAKERAVALERTATAIRTEAVQTARGYPHATGALAESIDVTGTPLTKIVGSPLREAFFLEYGSPNTGGPRPWLTGPARVGMTKLLVELGHVAEPW
jgi:hypothetical protein